MGPAGSASSATPRGASRSIVVPVAAILLAAFGAYALREVSFRRDRTNVVSQIRSPALVCRSYSADWEGSYPPSLEALVPDYIDAPEVLAWKTRGGQRLPFIYHPGSKDSSDPDLPLIESPVLIGNLRAVGYAGGQVREVVVR